MNIPPMPELEKRFVPCPTSGCWLWIGCTEKDGYGVISIGKKQLRAHRVVYEAYRGAIGDGLVIDHLCKNRGCVNPDHLEPVTPSINTLRGNSISSTNRSKQTCPMGHPYAVASRQRYCKTCAKDKWQRFIEKKRASSPNFERDRSRAKRLRGVK